MRSIRTSTSRAGERPAPGPGARRGRRPARRLARRLLLAGLVLAVLGVLLVLAGAGLAARQAKQAVDHLVSAGHALSAGDRAAARREGDQARDELAQARRLSAPLRAGRTLGLTPAQDADHLLVTAERVSDALEEAVTLTDPANLSLFAAGRVDLVRLGAATSGLSRIRADLDTAVVQAQAVRGGVTSPFTRQLAQRALPALQRARDLVDTADSVGARLAPALGSQGPRSYAVTLLNYAELNPGGGAPLSVLLVRADQGRISVLQSGQSSDLTGNEPLTWPFLPGDPWQQQRTVHRFVTSNLSPDFPTSGEELLRAYAASFGTHPDGVVAVNSTAIADLLAVTGPVTVPGQGTVSSANLVARTLLDAYQGLTDKASNTARHQANDQIMARMTAALLSHPPALTRLTPLLTSARNGNIRLYLRDPVLEEGVLAAGLGHQLPLTAGDQLGVYTQNSNANKLDVWQHRTITQEVTLGSDGAAAVHRSVVVVNRPPDICPAHDPGTGYRTCLAKPSFALYLPGRATGVRVQVDGRTVQPLHHFTERGRQVVQLSPFSLRRNQPAQIDLWYDLASPGGGTAAYDLRYDCQAMLHPAQLTVKVRRADGGPLTPAGSNQAAWRLDEGWMVATRSMLAGADLQLIR